MSKATSKHNFKATAAVVAEGAAGSGSSEAPLCPVGGDLLRHMTQGCHSMPGCASVRGACMGLLTRTRM